MRGGGYFLISVAEIRYRHDLVRLCHKFDFCPFQMKIPHIDEEKSCAALLSRALSRIFCFGGWGESIPKNFWSQAAARKFFLGLVGGPGACSLENLKR